jgi:hypothetical protein
MLVFLNACYDEDHPPEILIPNHLQLAISVLIKVLNNTVREYFTAKCISIRH